MASGIDPFRIAVADSDLEDLRQRLRQTRWPEAATVTDWTQGVPLSYVQELCGYWADEYDWRAREARLNQVPQYRTDLDGLGIHFLHIPSPEPDALPLIITHGWPGSIVEFMEVIGPLTNPGAHGGNPKDAFHVVAPSLPGYAWSDKPTTTGWGLQHIAAAWAALMDRLGYHRYGAQGGDWGAGVTTSLGRQDPEHVVGIHVNLVVGTPEPGQTEFTADEHESLAAMSRYMESESGYMQEQSTRPQTLGYGLSDSPAGQCAWILEKFHAWTDCDNDPVAAFGADRILDNIMLYWLPGAGASSARLYWESYPGAMTGLGPVEVPAGASIFPKEIIRAPRHWASRTYTDLRYWNQLDRGGHFAAFEQPGLFVDEVRTFFRLIR
jgi:pimeloyl-ACP methyl ester carboxylesterase